MSAPAPRRIVVGVDGSAGAVAALLWGAEEAGLRGTALDLVHCRSFRKDLLDSYPSLSSEESQVLAEALARAAEAAPSVELTGRVVDPPAATALVEASEGAEMLVVGSRGLGGFEEMLLGSVSHQCVLHARCSVVVVRP